ncbi:uncharacterized protein LOC143428551 [Xylocopa sonorina]|uniref:uncharacterized protein LOC143428551 n=1 Tax=Xylocopa sonorina TaxID=1818115 RepID=UPI00403B190E
MPLNTQVNKWAPKLTIIFQLTIWSTVGVILLQKGAISLSEKLKERNDTVTIQEILTRQKKGELIKESHVTESYFKTVKFRIGTQPNDVITDNSMDATSNEQWPRKVHINSPKMGKTGSGAFETSTLKKQITIDREHDARDIRSIQTPTVHTSNKNEVEKIDRKENATVSRNFNGNAYDIENTTVLFEIKDSESTSFVTPSERNIEHGNNNMSYKSTEKYRNEIKSRLQPVNRVGAAIAIVMLAIGVLMLLLGPLIVIVRAFNNKRRIRKILKAKNSNDLPPTYEEATLMDQAPRYSTLQLNTLLDSSSSSSSSV